MPGVYKPLCFMIMPYGRKGTQAQKDEGPNDIDFNALWDKVYVPVITQLGYQPVRADQDIGSLIITQMLERLYFADLVLADMTIANGNVYYEVGIRHAAKRSGCVLLAADWSKALFDVAQMRTVRYPLPEGDITVATAEAIRRQIAEPIRSLSSGVAPLFEVIRGYPNNVDQGAASTMQDYLRGLADLQGEIRAIRALPREQRMARAKALAEGNDAASMTAPAAIALVRCLRESSRTKQDWQDVVAFITKLPAAMVTEAEFREQRAFALSNAGDDLGSIAEIQALIAAVGPTPERLGLLGGRYRRLMDKAEPLAEKARQRCLAIDAYERGMDLDLNEFYCSSNLPRLYRERGRKDDEKLAQSVLGQVLLACDRATARGSSDEWLPATRLTAAFDAGAVEKAEAYAETMNFSDTVPYRSQWYLDDLSKSAKHVTNAKRKARLDAIVARLQTELA